MQFVHVVSFLCNGSPLSRCTFHCLPYKVNSHRHTIDKWFITYPTWNITLYAQQIAHVVSCLYNDSQAPIARRSALRYHNLPSPTVLSPYESCNVYRFVKWVTQLLTAPIATWKLYLDPRFSRTTQPISQLASWPYKEKGLPVVTANEKHGLQF
jgi:hypothetical protein